MLKIGHQDAEGIPPASAAVRLAAAAVAVGATLLVGS